MNDILLNSLFFGVMVSFATYEAGIFIRKKCGLAIFNPLLFSIVALILILSAFNIDYKTYHEGAKYLSYLLTPATVCLAVPLYEQFELLKKNVRAILAGIFSGVITSAVCVLALSILFGLSHKEYVTLLPKSITTAIGMGVSQELGGIVTITVAVIIITGVFGNITADIVCKLFKIEEPIAKGIAIGSSAHAVGTAKAMELGEIEGAMSSLSIAVSGLLTVFVATLFSYFL
ncbi:MAG: LrgB family protein [Lachnospiraceae bacterium]|nr:LrgB family protein [Lachnospiraceae bacterium]